MLSATGPPGPGEEAAWTGGNLNRGQRGVSGVTTYLGSV